MAVLRLLGPVTVEEEGNDPVRRFRSRSAVAVLAYLALHLDRSVPREDLVEAVWPEDDPESARASLRTALHSLRGLASVELIGSDRSAVWLNRDAVTVDAVEFERELRTAARAQEPGIRGEALDRALGWARAPLLAGVSFAWVAPHQLAFEEAFSRAVADRVALHLEAGEADRAVTLGRGALRHYPTREAIHVALIRALNASGQRAEAVRQFETLESWLDEEWGETPSQAAVSALQAEPDPLPHLAVVQPIPAPAAGRQASRSLPTLSRRLFGREQEATRLAAALTDPDGPRLLTVTGAGGSGKTVLALLVAHRIREDFAGRVAYVELGSLEEPGHVPGRLAEAMELSHPGAPGVRDRIAETVGDDPWLFVLDNAEHLLPGLVDQVEALLRMGPAVRILTTSRVTLDAVSEHVFPTGTLPVPVAADSLEDVSGSPSVMLLVDRIRALRPEFQLANSNVGVIVGLCQELDGLPLALELAAGQTAVMTPAQILVKLRDRCLRLAGSTRGVSERHRSLEAVLERSYGLLTEAAQRFYRAVSVFRSSFNLEAAEAVSGDPDALERVRELVTSSLLERLETFDSVRFSILRPLQSYAWAKAVDAGEREELEGRLTDWAVSLVISVRPMFDGPHAAEATKLLEAEHDTLRQVVDLALDGSIPVLPALRVFSGSVYFIRMRGYDREWLDRGTALLARAGSDLDPIVLALARSAEGNLNKNLSRYEEAARCFQQAVELFDQVGKPVDQGGSRSNLGMALTAAGRMDEAIAVMEEGLRRVGDEQEPSVWPPNAVRAALQGNLAIHYRRSGRHEDAIAIFRRLAAQCERDGLKRLLPPISIGMAANLLDLGRLEEARAAATHALRLAEEIGIVPDSADAEGVLAWICVREGDWVGAGVHALASVRMSRTAMLVETVAAGLSMLALSIDALGGRAEAALCLQAARDLGTGFWDETVPWQKEALAPLSGLWGSLADGGSPGDLGTVLRGAEAFLESLNVSGAGVPRET